MMTILREVGRTMAAGDYEAQGQLIHRRLARIYVDTSASRRLNPRFA